MKKIFLFAVLSLTALVGVVIPGQAQTKENQVNVAILIFEGVQIIDYTGPYEVLGSRRNELLGSRTRRKVFTVAEKANTITTNMGMRVVPNYTFENQPKADIVIIPGGGNSAPGANARGVGAQLENQRVIKWIQDNAKDAKYVMSVCNGAFLLARAGLLENLEATTTAGFIKDLKAFSPTTKVVYDKRYVDNGKIITTAGLSSGIDGALHLIEKMDGAMWAKSIALGIEYDWQPEANYARAALADMKLPESIWNAFDSNVELLDFKGGRDNWEEKWLVKTSSTPTELLENINKLWATEANWTRAKTLRSETVWKLTEKDGKTWKGQVNLEPSAEAGKLVLTLKVTRA